MLARSRMVTLRNGEQIRTPLLVPSISSKGFNFIERTSPGDEEAKPRRLSEAGLYLEVAAPNINESLLVSGYDLHHGFLPLTDAFYGGFLESMYGNPQILIIDSGGYEVRAGYDEDDVFHYPAGREFSPDEYSDLIGRFVPEVRAVIVNPDLPGAPYEDQIRAAQDFFGRLAGALSSDFLVKPDSDRMLHRVDRLGAVVDELRQFDIIGVAEKELGNSVQDRMLAVAQLRLLLDDHDVTAPIHVFGALDPLLTQVYFLAGGEIFDGLTWLRYWFVDGRAVYAPSYPAVTDSYPLRRPQWQSKMHSANLDYIQRLGNHMRVYATDRSFAVFKPNDEIVEQAYARLRAIEGRA